MKFLFVIPFLLFIGCKQLSVFENREPAGVVSVAKPIVLIGLIPAEYFQKDKTAYAIGYIEIANRIIQKMAMIQENEIDALILQQRKMGKVVIQLKQAGHKNFDIIYPGLINLHNHPKQNVLPTWSFAKGQFQNRFEWRGWGAYKKSVSQNMNPWVGFGKPVDCAAFRWSNLLNMINGGIYLQGDSSCTTGFGALRVEDKDSYISKKIAVQAPTDLILPNEMTYVWDVLAPKIRAGKTYEQALAEDINEHCPSLTMVNASTVNTAAVLSIFKKKKDLTAACQVGVLHEKFIRYVYWVHPTIAGKKEYLKSPLQSAIIAHLGEGRRLDPYNVIEYQLVKLLGMNQPHVNFIHGVGISKVDFSDMKKNNMGLIWSPYSNLLLYGQTLDILSAQQAGVNIAIGSDWLPTGSKSVLEEIKLAARYVDREKINSIFNDEVLYKMMTENPARMINHWEINSTEAGIGRLAVGAMGSVIVTTARHQNPHTNLVRNVTEKDINLVVVDGNPIYGNTPYLEEAGINQYEIFSNEIIEAQNAVTNFPFPKLPEKIKTAPVVDDELATSESEVVSTPADPGVNNFFSQYSSVLKNIRFQEKDNCQFVIPKAFVNPNTKTIEPTIEAFYRMSQLDLDRIKDIRQVLAVSLMSHSLNKLTPTVDNARYTLNYFPPIYSCNDPRHLTRLLNYVTPDGNDELKQNLAKRAEYRALKGMPKVAQKLAEKYKQTYVEK